VGTNINYYEKINKASVNIFFVYCAAAVFTLAACSTTGMQRSEDVQSSLETVDNDIKPIVV
jgi:uncharacterized lipoprotein